MRQGCDGKQNVNVGILSQLVNGPLSIVIGYVGTLDLSDDLRYLDRSITISNPTDEQIEQGCRF